MDKNRHKEGFLLLLQFWSLNVLLLLSLFLLRVERNETEYRSNLSLQWPSLTVLCPKTQIQRKRVKIDATSWLTTESFFAYNYFWGAFSVRAFFLAVPKPQKLTGMKY